MTPRLVIVHYENPNRGFVHNVPPSLIEPKTHFRVAHHLKDDITTAVCSSRKGRVATLSTASHLNRRTWTVVITTWLEANWGVILRSLVPQRTERFSRQKPLTGR